MHSSLPSDADVRAWVTAQDWSKIAHHAAALAPEVVTSVVLCNAAYRAFQTLGDELLAGPWLERTLQLAPDNSTLWRNKGLRQQQQGDWVAAVESFSRACSLKPLVASYHSCLGTALARVGKHDEAVAAYCQAVTLDPDHRNWWLRLAQASIHSEQLHEAASAYRQALSMQDDKNTRHAYEELLRQIRSGTRAASASYYDGVFADSPKYAQDADASVYVPAWRRIVQALESCGAGSVLDLGCGPGQFAEFLGRHLPRIAYCGVDFSPVAIQQARERCPAFRFEQRELPLPETSDLPPFDVVICTEVLEHVERDRDILAALPAGVPVLATVPNYDSFGHLRVFRDIESVTSRYGDLLTGLTVEPQPIAADRVLWLIQGRRSEQVYRPVAPLPSTVDSNMRASAAARFAVESQFMADGTRYLQDFLPLFGLPFTTVVDSLGRRDAHVALRHDIDWSLENAMVMAELEHQQGIRSSYYLLHPDGAVQTHNYFGHLDGAKLVMAPALFEAARRLVDLGHEVGLHNDLISLSLTTGVAPGDYLEQIVEAFLRAGIDIQGSVAHGSKTCRSLGYMNFQIFSDFTPTDIAVDYQDRPELFECFADETVSANGNTVTKFALKMADYGLRYEANFTPRDLYLSDSSARWTLWQGPEATRFDKHTPRSVWEPVLLSRLAALPGPQRVQALVHACHWGALLHFNERALPSVRGRRDQDVQQRIRDRIGERLAAFANVVKAAPSARFEVYDQQYASHAQLYSIASTVRQFTETLVAGIRPPLRQVLELGCGQGDYLAFTCDAVTRKHGTAPAGLGIDGSAAAILGCAGRYPSLRWACDSVERFVEEHDAMFGERGETPPRWDLVLDKTGTIFIPDPDSARRFLQHLSSRMAPGALYVYVASRHYYREVLRKKNHGDWPMDWLTLVEEVFEPVSADDDEMPALKGYLKRVFRRR